MQCPYVCSYWINCSTFKIHIYFVIPPQSHEGKIPGTTTNKQTTSTSPCIDNSHNHLSDRLMIKILIDFAQQTLVVSTHHLAPVRESANWPPYFFVISYARKRAPVAGNVLTTVGPSPLYNARIPAYHAMQTCLISLSETLWEMLEAWFSEKMPLS